MKQISLANRAFKRDGPIRRGQFPATSQSDGFITTPTNQRAPVHLTLTNGSRDISCRPIADSASINEIKCIISGVPDWTFHHHQPYEMLTPHGIVGARLRVPLEPIGTILLWCLKGFRGALNCAPVMSRSASLSDRSTPDRCIISKGAGFVSPALEILRD